jgi:hypothetical protein
MSKRFTDTNKYKKQFIRQLPGAYKLLWDYLYHDCDHAGIWIVDFEVAQLFLGQDMPVNKVKALELFNRQEQRIVELDGGSKWFIKPFIEFQYGELNPQNRAHVSAISTLKKYGLQGASKVLVSPLQGAKDKEQDKDKDKDKERGCGGKQFTLKEVQDSAYLVGLNPEQSKLFFDHYNAQGWRRANGLAITDLPSMLAWWKQNQCKFDKPQQTGQAPAEDPLETFRKGLKDE